MTKKETWICPDCKREQEHSMQYGLHVKPYCINCYCKRNGIAELPMKHIIICYECEHYQNDCDILAQIQNIADTYDLELSVNVYKCAAVKRKKE